jgi:hypothetical protein
LSDCATTRVFVDGVRFINDQGSISDMTVYSFDLEKCSRTIEGLNQWERWPISSPSKTTILRVTVDASLAEIRIWTMSSSDSEPHVGWKLGPFA